MPTYIVVIIASAVIFSSGWGWGQWYAEREMRREKQATDRVRLLVSMPMKAEDAAATMALLSELVAQVRESKLE